MRTGHREAEKGYASTQTEAGSVSHPPCERSQRKVVLESLRESIRRIENRSPTLRINEETPAAGSPSGLPVEDGGAYPRHARTLVPSSSPSFLSSQKNVSRDLQITGQKASRPASVWSLGDDAFEDLIGPHGLEIDCVHEIKPAIDDDCADAIGSVAGKPSSEKLSWVASWSAARAFLLRLLACRLRTCSNQPGGHTTVLWCWPQMFAQEFGGLYAPGLAGLGINPEGLTIVAPTRPQEVLWAMEEGLKSASVACVVGILDEVDLTPARRLALAAQKAGVPAIILTAPRTPAMAATATRWRIAPTTSASHPIVQDLPGDLRLALRLERRRNHALVGRAAATIVEWCEETHRFRKVNDAWDQAGWRPIGSAARTTGLPTTDLRIAT